MIFSPHDRKRQKLAEFVGQQDQRCPPDQQPGDRGVRPLYLFGATHHSRETPGCHWKIVELTSQFELDFEGERMQHCVATYAFRCAAGSCSIWSLRRVSLQGTRSIATLEVRKDNGRRVLVQARSCRNGTLTPECAKIVEQWRTQNGIEQPS